MIFDHFLTPENSTKVARAPPVAFINLVSPVFCLMLFLASPLKLEQRRKGRFHKFIQKLKNHQQKHDFDGFGGQLETQE